MRCKILMLAITAPLFAQKPDVSGVWETRNLAAWDIADHGATYISPASKGIVDGGNLPYLPAALAQRDDNRKHPERDPDARCHLPGIPRAVYNQPWKVIQTANEITILYEYVHGWRVIPLDGRKHSATCETWSGDSIGHWEGNTLVVDVTNFNGETWFDMSGNFHSNALHVVERYTLADANSINYEATIEDPKTFSRPWTMKMTVHRIADKAFQLAEYECADADRPPR